MPHDKFHELQTYSRLSVNRTGRLRGSAKASIWSRLLLAAVFTLGSHAASAGELVSVKSRNVTQNVYINSTSTSPEWVVVLFAGGEGVVALAAGGPTSEQGNFLVRTASYWTNVGDAAVVFDAPSDQADGMDDEFRLSAAASQDVAAVVVELKKRYPSSRIALVGTSRGTITVGNVLLRNPDLADAFVLTSPVSIAVHGKPGLSGVTWHQSMARVLVLSNEHDVCVASPFWAAKRMATDNHFDFVAVSSTSGGGDKHSECGGQAPHGYLGIETKVLAAINEWLHGPKAAFRSE
ncbi:alpha/beta hydrolase family protein [Burkholderia theae]|uniref:alpha/beta hydrolase family protein n=1 Tax=Burkholderia theae TaxID=3143496 RepID=UPI003AFB38B5